MRSSGGETGERPGFSGNRFPNFLLKTGLEKPVFEEKASKDRFPSKLLFEECLQKAVPKRRFSNSDSQFRNRERAAFSQMLEKFVQTEYRRWNVPSSKQKSKEKFAFKPFKLSENYNIEKTGHRPTSVFG